jgi:hypothetical protein
LGRYLPDTEGPWFTVLNGSFGGANPSLIGQNLTVTELKYPPVSGHPQMSQKGREATVGGPLGLPIANRQKPVVQRFKLPALKHAFPGAPARHSLMMDRYCRIQSLQRISDTDNPGAPKLIARIATNKFRATYIVEGNSTPGLSLTCGIFCYCCRFPSGWLQIRSVRRTRGKNCRYGDSTNSAYVSSHAAPPRCANCTPCRRQFKIGPQTPIVTWPRVVILRSCWFSGAPRGLH